MYTCKQTNNASTVCNNNAYAILVTNIKTIRTVS